MKNVLYLTLTLLSLTSIRTQLLPPEVSATTLLPSLATILPELVVGSGDDGVIITHLWEDNNEELLIHFEATELDVADDNEWTVSWINEDGEAYHLAAVDGDILAVGPNGATSIGQNITAITSIPQVFDDYLIGSLAKDLVNLVEREGGSDTKTVDTTYYLGIAALDHALQRVQNGGANAENIAANVVATIEASHFLGRQ